MLGKRQLPCGRLQVPLTQLSEQQSVFWAQGWWKLLQVTQLTPTSHVGPLQQPFEHEAAVQTHWPAWQICPI